MTKILVFDLEVKKILVIKVFDFKVKNFWQMIIFKIMWKNIVDRISNFYAQSQMLLKPQNLSCLQSYAIATAKLDKCKGEKWVYWKDIIIW